jgi:hypothetical protein
VDRSKLGTNENLLLHLAYIPLGVNQVTPECDRDPAVLISDPSVPYRTYSASDHCRDPLDPAYVPGDPHDQVSGIKKNFTLSQSAQLRVYLLNMGNPTTDLIRAAAQPRNLTNGYLLRPKVVDTLAVLGPADGQLHEDQIFVPLATNSLVDRIRVERVQGSAILVSASIYRMGH